MIIDSLLTSTCLLNLDKPFDSNLEASIQGEYGVALIIENVTLADLQNIQQAIEVGTRFSPHGFQTLNFLVILPQDEGYRRAAVTALNRLTGKAGVIEVEVRDGEGIIVKAFHSKYTRLFDRL